MNYWGIGLDTNGVTWLVYGIVVVVWAGTLAIATPVRSRGWRAVPTTLFGFAWVGFGLDIVLRFLILSTDSVDFGDGSLRLAVLPTDVLNRCLVASGVFWICLTAGYLVARRNRLPNPWQALAEVTSRDLYRSLPTVLTLTSACVYLSLHEFLPKALITPLALLGSLWVLPATLAWWDYFQGSSQGDKHRFEASPRMVPKVALGRVYLLVLLPGLIGVWLNPYREWVATVFLVPFLAALFAGRRPKLSRVAAGGLIFLVVSTALVHSYRNVVWLGEGTADLELEANSWRQGSMDAPWIEPFRRFHALDSLLLTANLFPDVLPYSGKNVFAESVLRGVVPRAIQSNKAEDNGAVEFGRTIWSNDTSSGSAPIAPSLPGSLYSAGGMVFVLLGGVFWGALIGICESWIRLLPAGAQAALVALCSMSMAASIERDFIHNVSTLIQQAIVLSCVLAMIAVCATGSRRNGRYRLPRPYLATNPPQGESRTR